MLLCLLNIRLDCLCVCLKPQYLRQRTTQIQISKHHSNLLTIETLFVLTYLEKMHQYYKILKIQFYSFTSEINPCAQLHIIAFFPNCSFTYQILKSDYIKHSQYYLFKQIHLYTLQNTFPVSYTAQLTLLIHLNTNCSTSMNTIFLKIQNIRCIVK